VVIAIFERENSMSSVSVLVVDDEPLGRERIVRFLKTRNDVRVDAEAGDGKQAVDAIKNGAFDLVFLDIQMPHLTGLDVVREIGPENMPAVIFTTAFDDYAIEAFKVHALDYLLKPIEPERFHASVDRVLDMLQNHPGPDLETRLIKLLQEEKQSAEPVSRFMIKSHQQIAFVKADEIDWIEAAGNYVNLHVDKESHLLRLTMKQIEAKLDPARFLRIHRSTIVNLDGVHDLRQMFNGEYEVRLKSGKKLTMSRNYRKNLDRFS